MERTSRSPARALLFRGIQARGMPVRKGTDRERLVRRWACAIRVRRVQLKPSAPESAQTPTLANVRPRRMFFTRRGRRFGSAIAGSGLVSPGGDHRETPSPKRTWSTGSSTTPRSSCSKARATQNAAESRKTPGRRSADCSGGLPPPTLWAPCNRSVPHETSSSPA